MVDNNENKDEYQFADLDINNLENMDEELGADHFDNTKKVETGTNVRRNALIVVGVIVLAMIVYKFMGAIFSGKKATSPTPVATISPAPKPVEPVVQQAPVLKTTTSPVDDLQAASSQVNQKLSSLDQSQQSLRSDLTAANNQLGSISTNVSELNSKIDSLNEAIKVLATKLEQQSQEIILLTARTKPKPVRPVTRKTMRARLVYHIQAIIPGRAWLIAGNGSTLTVREGTIIPGYGVVKLIDPTQGRVLMSTGQVIRFSQQDS